MFCICRDLQLQALQVLHAADRLQGGKKRQGTHEADAEVRQ